MDISKFIQSAVAGDALQAKEALNDILSSRAFEAIDGRKKELSQTIFGGKPEEVEVEMQDTVDSEVEDEELLTQEEFNALSEEDQELYLEALEQLDEISLKTATKAYKARAQKAYDTEDEKEINKQSAQSGRMIKKFGKAGYKAVDSVHRQYDNYKEEFEEFQSLSEENKNLYMEMLDSIETHLREIGLLDEEQLDEISVTAAKNYLHKAVPSSSKLNQKSAKPGEKAAEKYNYSYENAPYETKQFQKFSKRRTGIRKAINKLESAHPDNKKHAKIARQAFNSIYSDNYRVGMHEPRMGQKIDKEKENIRNAHKTVKAAVNAMHKNAMTK